MSVLIRQRIFIFFVPLFLALPFINRAYFVDDNYFVEIASWLKDNPTLPYHFRADDAGLQNRGWEENGFVRMVNPLAHQYYLALLLKIGGAREWFLRLGCVLLSCFSAFFLFEFARRWTNSPVLTTLLILVTPAMWLSSYSLLIDPTMVFFAFGALYFFIRGCETGGLLPLLASGICAGLAILSKYTGLFVLPLMGTCFVLKWKKLKAHWLYVIPMIIALGFLLAYGQWTAVLYGRAHILAASERMLGGFGGVKVFSLFVFLAGSLLVPLLIWLVVTLEARIVGALLMFVTAVFLSTKLGGYTFLQSGLLGLWFVTGVLLPGIFASMRKEWVFPRDHFIFLWLAGFIGMMLLVMDWVAARYFCLVAPAVVMAVVRMIEIKKPQQATRILSLTLAGVFLVSTALAYSDYKQAEPSRKVRAALKENNLLGGPRHFFLGDSFTMSYLKAEGWVPCFPETQFQVGDLILAKEVTMPLVWFARKQLMLQERVRFDYPSHFPLKVMDYAGSAGFYASVWGALPFTISTGSWERFYVFEVTGIKTNDPS